MSKGDFCMSIWTVEKIQEFYSNLNTLYGLSVNPDIIVEERNKFPLRRRNFKNLVFVPDFFNHDLITENMRMMMLLRMYSCFYLDKKMDGHLDINHGFLTKGLFDDLNLQYVSEAECEAQVRVVRRMLFDDIENGCYFSIGDQLREDSFNSYEVVDICRKNESDTIITVKPIGCHLGEPDKNFTEEELYSRCSNLFDFDKFKVDMRRNLFILCADYSVDKNDILKKLQEYCPEATKTISTTTKKPSPNEKNCIDYYFVSIDEFYDYQMNGSLIESSLYSGDHYGTLFTEIIRYQEDIPLFIIADIHNKREIMSHCPLSKTIYIQLDNSESAEKHTIKTAPVNGTEFISNSDETELKNSFDYVLTYKNTDDCAKEINSIVKENMWFTIYNILMYASDYYCRTHQVPLSEDMVVELSKRLEVLLHKEHKTIKEENELKTIISIFVLYEQEDILKNFQI